MTNPLKLEVGKTYLDRLGREIPIRSESLGEKADSIFRFDSDFYSYGSDGRFISVQQAITTSLPRNSLLPSHPSTKLPLKAGEPK